MAHAGIELVHLHGFIEVDSFEFSLGFLEIIAPNGQATDIWVGGPTTVRVFFEGPGPDGGLADEGDANDDDSNGRDDVVTQIIDMRLEGETLGTGRIVVGVNPDPALPSLGGIEELSNIVPQRLDLAPFYSGGGTADSFFQLNLQIEVFGTVL